MTSYTLENVFILTVFQLLVAGLILCSTCASLYLQKEPSVRKILKLLVLAFILYSTHFFLEAGVHYRNLSSSTPAPLSREWGFLADATEMLAFVCLALAYLPSRLAEKQREEFRWVIPCGDAVAGDVLLCAATVADGSVRARRGHISAERRFAGWSRTRTPAGERAEGSFSGSAALRPCSGAVSACCHA